MTDVPFYVRAHLRTPVILGKRLTLDALLAGIVFRQTRDLEMAHESLPLARLGGGDLPAVWQGSQALPEGHQAFTTMPYTMSLRANSLTTRDIATTPRGKEKRPYIPKISAASGHYKNIMTHYDAVLTPSLWWVGVGDVAAVKAILTGGRWAGHDWGNGVRAVGAKASSGSGEVSQWTVCSIPASSLTSPLPGILDETGRLLRPVPLTLYEALRQENPALPPATSIPDSMIEQETYAPPYWRTENSEICVTPLPTAGVADMKEALIRLTGQAPKTHPLRRSA